MVEMQVNVQRLSPVLVEFDVEVGVGRVTTELEKAYNQVARTAKVRGFRPGKAPRLGSEASSAPHISCPCATKKADPVRRQPNGVQRSRERDASRV